MRDPTVMRGYQRLQAGCKSGDLLNCEAYFCVLKTV